MKNGKWKPSIIISTISVLIVIGGIIFSQGKFMGETKTSFVFIKKELATVSEDISSIDNKLDSIILDKVKEGSSKEIAEEE